MISQHIEAYIVRENVWVIMSLYCYIAKPKTNATVLTKTNKLITTDNQLPAVPTAGAALYRPVYTNNPP